MMPSDRGSTPRTSTKNKYGAVAQLGERHNGIVEVVGSSPISSTRKIKGSRYPARYQNPFLVLNWCPYGGVKIMIDLGKARLRFEELGLLSADSLLDSLLERVQL